MKIVVTGSEGFVGRYLVELLKRGRDKIYPLDRKQADITKYSAVLSYLRKIQPDQVYHLAGFASGAGKDRDLIFKVNVDGTLNILKALKNIGKPCRILLASTAYVYGNTPKPATEKTKFDLHSFYDKSKAEMEKNALKYQTNKIEIIISRATNHAGAGQKMGFVIPDFASQLANLKSGEKMLVGNLDAERDFFDVRDCVRAYKILMQKGTSGEIYNIGTGRAVKVEIILKKLLKISKKKIEISQDPKRMRPSDIRRNTVNIAKIKKLGWKPNISLEKTLKDVYHSFLS